MGYCRYCGKKLEEGEVCTCRQQDGTQTGQNHSNGTQTGWDFSNGIRQPYGGLYQTMRQNNTSDPGTFERGKQIVNECVMPMEEEIPIRQYDAAILRTIFPHKRAEGRIQVTNKRVIFRAAGRARMRKITYESEFKLENIAGVEITTDRSANGWFIFVGILALLLASWVGSLLGNALAVAGHGSFMDPNKSALVMAFVFAAVGVVTCVFLEKQAWLKEMLFGVSANIFFTYGTYSFRRVWIVFGVIAIIVAIVFLIVYSIRDEVIICIKAEDAVDAIRVQKRGSGRRRVEKVYTKFAEVLPWTDTDRVIRELGALIQDVKQYGAAGINKWKQ